MVREKPAAVQKGNIIGKRYRSRNRRIKRDLTAVHALLSSRKNDDDDDDNKNHASVYNFISHVRPIYTPVYPRDRAGLGLCVALAVSTIYGLSLKTVTVPYARNRADNAADFCRNRLRRFAARRRPGISFESTSVVGFPPTFDRRFPPRRIKRKPAPSRPAAKFRSVSLDFAFKIIEPTSSRPPLSRHPAAPPYSLAQLRYDVTRTRAPFEFSGRYPR